MSHYLFCWCRVRRWDPTPPEGTGKTPPTWRIACIEERALKYGHSHSAKKKTNSYHKEWDKPTESNRQPQRDTHELCFECDHGGKLTRRLLEKVGHVLHQYVILRPYERADEIERDFSKRDTKRERSGTDRGDGQRMLLNRNTTVVKELNLALMLSNTLNIAKNTVESLTCL